jgi:hypothetical protein
MRYLYSCYCGRNNRYCNNNIKSQLVDSFCYICGGHLQLKGIAPSSCRELSERIEKLEQRTEKLENVENNYAKRIDLLEKKIDVALSCITGIARGLGMPSETINEFKALRKCKSS